VEHPFENYGVQRNWAQQNLPIRSEWVLHLDADERLTPELVKEICQVLGARGKREGVRSEASGVKGREELDEIDGFLLRKRTIFMGRWIKHGGHYPSYHLRLFRRDRGFCEDRLYDQHFLANGKIRRLKHDYIDVLTSDLRIWTLRHIRWAELEAQEILAGQNSQRRVRPALLGNPIERRRWLREGLYARLPLFARAFLYWVYRYFLRLGFLDGQEGFIFHFLQGFWFRLLVDIKLEGLRRDSGSVYRKG
jgi:glycosyltransferase involved in cell wall biosynthesis